MDSNARITIVGDQEIAREGLRHILAEMGHEAACLGPSALPAALAMLADEPDHIILVDMRSRDESLRVCGAVRGGLAHARVAILTGDQHSDMLELALAIPVDGVLTKSMSYEVLSSKLRLIALGEKIVPFAMIERSLRAEVRSIDDRRDEATVEDLSARELTVLRSLAAGDSNKHIARRLDITEATVKVHVKTILRKLKVANRTQAAIRAARHGLVDRRASGNPAVIHAAMAGRTYPPFASPSLQSA